MYVDDPALNLIVRDGIDTTVDNIGVYILIPISWFAYSSTGRMPLYVSARIVAKARADKPSFTVQMHSDVVGKGGEKELNVNYYIEKHPRAYKGMEHLYLTSPEVKVLSSAPPVMI